MDLNRLLAIAYVSTLTAPRSEARIEALLADARAFNETVGVTGALLVQDSSVFQYFEGSADGVARVYERILASRAHKDIVELYNKSVADCVFSGWFMGFALAPRSVTLQLAQAHWRTEVEVQRHLPRQSLGLNLLLDFCSHVPGGMSRQ
jgi:hypothetical protein